MNSENKDVFVNLYSIHKKWKFVVLVESISNPDSFK